MSRPLLWIAAMLATSVPPVLADPPVASYIFPAGGRRGTAVDVRVGGVNLHSRASFEVLGPGVEAVPEVRAVETTWFERPLLPLPDSQQAEDYPKDHAGTITIAADAPVGPRAWRVWTSQGASGSLPFIVGDLPEVVEREAEGDPIAESVSLPVTINGRIFPREDVDLWSFSLRAGQWVTGTVLAGRLGSRLDPWLEVLDPDGLRIAEGAPSPGCDARAAFRAAADGLYTARIHDVNVKGGQSYVYRLTLKAGPDVERVFPLGGRRGSSVAFEPIGNGLPDRTPPATLTSDGTGRGPEPSVVELVPGLSTPIEVDDLPEVLEGEPGRANPLPIPGVGNGRVEVPGNVDAWAVTLVKDRPCEFDLRAARLGSDLLAVLTLEDPAGKEVAKAEGLATRGGDPWIAFRPPADGVYVAKVRDRFRSRGGPSSAYRLRVAEGPEPDFRLSLATDTLGVPRGGSEKLKLDCERLGGFAGAVAIQVERLPEGMSLAPLVIAPAAASAELVFSASKDAPIRSGRLRVVGTSEIGTATARRTAARRGPVGFPEVDDLRLAVALPTPFKLTGPVNFGWAPRGSLRRRKYALARGGFTGAVEVRMADRQARHLQGVAGPTVTVPPGQDEFIYPVSLPPWMEVGRTSRAVVMATGIVREPDGTEHEVSFSSIVNDLQISAVIGPGLLALEPGRTSIMVDPGGFVEVPIRVARGQSVDGPVRVELVAGPSVRGLAAEPLILDKGRDEGRLRIRRDPSRERLASARIPIRASASVDGDPVTAEASITLVDADGGDSPGQGP